MSFSSELKDRRLIKNATFTRPISAGTSINEPTISTNALAGVQAENSDRDSISRQQRFTRLHLSRYWHSPQVNCSAVMESADAASEMEG